MKLPVRIIGGTLKGDKEAIRNHIARSKDGDYIYELRKARHRSSQVNRYYHKILAILANGLNLYPDDVKQMVKKKLNHYEHIKNPEGENEVRFWSTADYTNEMFNEAIQLVQYWGSINNIYIMDSEEYKMQFEN